MVPITIAMTATTTTAALRKGSIGGGRVAMSTKRSSPTNGASTMELSIALSTLNEDTMAEACALLLNDSDDQSYIRLESILTKCQESHKIIQEHSLNVTVASASASASRSAVVLPHGSTAKALLPSVRRAGLSVSAVATRPLVKHTAMPPPRQMRTGTDRRARPPLVQQGSDSSLASGDSATVLPKKPRLENAAPPPEALSFLQALNAQKDKDSLSPTKSQKILLKPKPIPMQGMVALQQQQQQQQQLQLPKRSSRR